MAVYEKLPTSRSTRLLSFIPPPSATSDPSHEASGPGAVHCDWLVVSVDDPEPYFALSYVWGDPNVREHDLICNGRLIKITYNLWVALKAVWSKFPKKRLWVDAICINQDDIPERNQQVAMMGSIYSQAECVAVWVGEATAHSDDFFKIVGVVQGGDKLTMANCPRPTNDSKGTQGSDRDFMNHLLDCAADIVHRPWFVRAWTFQEIRLAGKAIIHCGPHATGIGLFNQTVTEINGISERHDLCGGRMNIPFFVANTSFKSLYRLLALTQPRKSTDPRDKVYSLLSMLPRDAYAFMKPDYALSYEEVFAYACRVCIEVDNEMNVLGGAGLQYDSESDDSRRNLPSWAVDWRVFNGHIYSWQNLSRSINITDTNALRIRNERGGKLDPTSREIHIPGVALGRFRVDKTNGLACLTNFPECATGSITSEMQEPPSCIKLSSGDMASVWRGLAFHDNHQCKCNAILERNPASYNLRDMPLGLKTGDWLWTTEIVEDMAKGRGDRGADKDEIHHFHYGLRPIEGAGEPRFQLIGKTNGLAPIQPEKPPRDGKQRRKTRKKVQPEVDQFKGHPVKIQAKFPIV